MKGSLVRCTGCDERCGSRPIGAYFRWMRADGQWIKYYAKLCTGCYAAKVVPLDQELAPDARLTCPGCGMDTEADYDAVYLTAFPGHGPQVDLTAPFCNVHAAEYRIWVTQAARQLDTVDGAPEPRPQGLVAAPAGDQVMRALGRKSHAR